MTAFLHDATRNRPGSNYVATNIENQALKQGKNVDLGLFVDLDLPTEN